MPLNIIDFSNGIRPEEIQENFNNLQEQLNRERISVGGAGIAYGLNIKFDVVNNVFNAIVTDGVIITKDGEELFINGKILEIEPPILHESVERMQLNNNKSITLKHVPYALNRKCPAEALDTYEPEISGININYINSKNVDDFIRVRDIKGKVLKLTGCQQNEVQVSYQYTAKRIDAIYIDKNYNIKVSKGTTSTTRSAIEPTDMEILLAYIEIDDCYRSENNTVPHADMHIIDDCRTIRKLYTDSNNRLFIDGTPFDDLQIIHIKEPKDPKENSLWLNPIDNTLYYWGVTDDHVYKYNIEIDFDYTIDFVGDLVFGTNLDYNINSKELAIYLNGSKLLLGIDYEELSSDLPNYSGNIAGTQKGNMFRILNTLSRTDNVDKNILLKSGDILTYTITYKDSQFMWIPLNKSSYINVKNTKVYCTEYEGLENPKYLYKNTYGQPCAYFDSTLANSLDETREYYEDESDAYPYKYQYFFFERERDLDMLYTPGRNELSIMINQIPLHEDQYKEISVHDIESLPDCIQDTLIKNYGWTPKYISDNYNKTSSFENCGIGFMLLNPLDSGYNAEGVNVSPESYDGSNSLFVEASVQRRITAGPINRKLERTATFVLEDKVESIDIKGLWVTIPNGKYAFGEHQLEVFRNGIKLIEGIDYIEQYGYLKEIRDSNSLIQYETIIPDDFNYEQDYESYYFESRSKACNRFKLNTADLLTGVLTYRITTNIYSYDHVNNYMDRLVERANDFEGFVVDFNNRLTGIINSFEDKTSPLVNAVNGFESLIDDIIEDTNNKHIELKSYFDQIKESTETTMSSTKSEIYNALNSNKDEVNNKINNAINQASDAFSGKYLELESTLNGVNESINNIENRLNDISGTTTENNSELQQQINNLETETSSKISDIINSVNGMASKHETDIAAVRAYVDAVKEDAERDIAANIAGIDSTITELSAQVEAMQEIADVAIETVNNNQEQIKQNKENIISNQTEINNIKTNIDSIEEDIESIKDTLQAIYKTTTFNVFGANNILDITEKDYINIVLISQETFFAQLSADDTFPVEITIPTSRTLRKGIDFTLEKINDTQCKINLYDTSTFKSMDTIYITGIKLV